ncbi:MAG: hypothetical protein HOE30_10815, partial [Deltaproteobacteria bacterium]|nr:hypothetical protein [Deltaproteobacteria bacterium]
GSGIEQYLPPLITTSYSSPEEASQPPNKTGTAPVMVWAWCRMNLDTPLIELESIEKPFGLTIERDIYFVQKRWSGVKK